MGFIIAIYWCITWSMEYSVLLLSRFLLGTEINSGDCESKVELAGKLTSAKVGTWRWLLHHSQRCLLSEKCKYVAVDAKGWPEAHVIQDLFSNNRTIGIPEVHKYSASECKPAYTSNYKQTIVGNVRDNIRKNKLNDAVKFNLYQCTEGYNSSTLT